MAEINNGELGLDVRNKLNETIRKADGTDPFGSIHIDGNLLVTNGDILMDGAVIHNEKLDSILNEDVISFIPLKRAGLLLLTTDPTDVNPKDNWSALIWYNVGTVRSINKVAVLPIGIDVDTTTVNVTGTSGTVGKVTIAVQPNEVKIENRSGATRDFAVLML